MAEIHHWVNLVLYTFAQPALWVLIDSMEGIPLSQRRISSRQRKLSLDEYRKAFLQVPRIEDRKPVFVSGEVRDRLDEFVRRLGGRKMSVSGLLENIARQHLEIYSEDFEQWRKL